MLHLPRQSPSVLILSCISSPCLLRSSSPLGNPHSTGHHRPTPRIPTSSLGGPSEGDATSCDGDGNCFRGLGEGVPVESSTGKDEELFLVSSAGCGTVRAVDELRVGSCGRECCESCTTVGEVVIDGSGSLSCLWPPIGVSDLTLSLDGNLIIEVDADIDSGGCSPRLTFSSINLSPTFRPRFISSLFRLESLLLLTPLPLRLRVALSLPSMMRALGGGCSIHWVSLRCVGCVLTTGGCRSLTAGLRAT